jgi:hypothetical protein
MRAVADSDDRAVAQRDIRRYLKPIFRCLRRNHRGVFTAAVTRYLKPVHAAKLADIEDFPRRQTLEA